MTTATRLVEKLRDVLLVLRVRWLLGLVRPDVRGIRFGWYDNPHWGWYLDVYVRVGDDRYQETFLTSIHDSSPAVRAAVRQQLLAQAVKFTGVVLRHQLRNDPAWADFGQKSKVERLVDTPT